LDSILTFAALRKLNLFMEIKDNFWKSKKVLVTGADGFIGSHLVEILLSGGAEVRALSQYNSFNFWGWLEDVPGNSNLEILSGDVRDAHYCKTICKNIDVVFHLAALIAIPFSYHSPGSYVETNINGTLNMCQAALDNGCSTFVHTSTSEVYGTAKYVPINELHPIQPQSPYSASKIGADALAMSFFNAFGLPLIIARPFNTYGPRQSARAVIPSIITQILSGKQHIDLGDTSPTRDFNFVSDTCNGFLKLAESGETIGKTINIGSNSEISIFNLFQKIKEISGRDVELKLDEQRLRPEKSEVHRLVCDNALIRSITDFKPLVSIEEGLRITFDWLSDPGNLAKYKANIYNI
jgi:NAD dependent epimerase/dehydratase